MATINMLFDGHEHEFRDQMICPCAVVKMQQQYNTNQNRLLMALVAKLQPVILRQFHGLKAVRQKPFPEEQLINGYVAIDLPLSLVSGVRDDYRVLRRALTQMSHLPVYVPVTSEGVCRWERVEQLLSVRYPETMGGANAYVYIYHTLANRLFSIDDGYFSFSRSTFQACMHRSTQMLYLLCEHWRNRGCVKLKMCYLTQLLLSGKSYRRFSEFRKRKLDVAHDELLHLYRQRKSTCYFTYHPVYEGSNVWREPTAIIFRVYTYGGYGADNTMQLQQAVARLLVKQFGLYEVQVKRLSSRINEWNYQPVVNKLHDLLFRYRHGGGINDTRAYTYVVVDRIIKEYASEQAVEQKLSLAA